MTAQGGDEGACCGVVLLRGDGLENVGVLGKPITSIRGGAGVKKSRFFYSTVWLLFYDTDSYDMGEVMVWKYISRRCVPLRCSDRKRAVRIFFWKPHKKKQEHKYAALHYYLIARSFDHVFSFSLIFASSLFCCRFLRARVPLVFFYGGGGVRRG